MGQRVAILMVVVLGVTATAGTESRSARAEAGHAEPARAQPAGSGKTTSGSAKPDPKAARPPGAGASPAQAGSVEAADAERAEPADSADPDAEDAQAAGGRALPAHVVGPRHVDLGNQVALDLPEGAVLIERAAAQELLRKSGEPADDIVGIAFKPDGSWHVLITYSGSGYIDDSDANDLDADDLLASYRKGTEEQNQRRKALGKPELVIDRWSETPRYERAQHHLVWGIQAHDTGGQVVNFFTRILGRNGFVSVDLIDQPERIEASKKEALAILQATRFGPGARYEDHASSDQSSGIGLRGLVLGAGGVAVASKLGLLAKLLAVFAKLLLVFKKALVVIVVGIGGFFRWLFRRRSSTAAANVADRAADADLAPHAAGLDAASADGAASDAAASEAEATSGSPASGDPPG